MDPVTKIRQGLKKDFASGRHSDLTLVVGSREFHVHKIVLSWQSSVFEAMLGPRWEKSSPTTNKKLSIPLPEDDPDIFETILNYIYTNSVEDKFCPPTTPIMIFWVHVYAAADKYGLDHLKGVVISKFKLHLNPNDIDNFVNAIVEVSDNTADRVLWNIIIPKIRENISFLISQPKFQELMLKMPQLNFDLLAMLDPNHVASVGPAPSIKLNLTQGQIQGSSAQDLHPENPSQGDDGDDDMDENEGDHGAAGPFMGASGVGNTSGRWQGRSGSSYGAGRRLGD
ncbi:POZ domain-containing protein [Polychaeton citri CBS 116435]|uniref:POZ domain-containing protein n=1 Tax=Polychaeton citri CBS 116435 TaxID=1314669 RepID=A0A9P4Q891_9PEZI|nr:POZ domain-containing protein [Polychaeton citri CBS 116435]